MYHLIDMSHNILYEKYRRKWFQTIMKLEDDSIAKTKILNSDDPNKELDLEKAKHRKYLDDMQENLERDMNSKFQSFYKKSNF